MNEVLLISLYLLASVGGLVLLKAGSSTNTLLLLKQTLRLEFSYLSLAGLFLYIISFVLWLVLINRYALSYIQPLTAGLSYILITLAALFILKENITLFQWGGIIFILIGIVLMNIGR